MKKYLNFILQACFLISLCACLPKGGKVKADIKAETGDTDGPSTSPAKIYNNCGEMTEPANCKAQAKPKLACWWKNDACLELYASCADIKDNKALCENHGNGQNKPTLRCKMEGGQCGTDILDLTDPASAEAKMPSDYEKAGWVVTVKDVAIPQTLPAQPLIVAQAKLDVPALAAPRTISVVFADIVKERVDAIVNAANGGLQGGGGVDGAIHQAAGADVLKAESAAYKIRHKIVSFPVGWAMITYAHKLAPAIKFVVHTVGPQGASTPETDRQLYFAVYNSLTKAAEYKATSISLPAISTGIFGYPLEKATEMFFKAALSFFAKNPDTSITDVRFTNFDAETVTGVNDRFVKVFTP